MNNYTLTVPEEVYIRAQQIAEETAQPVDQVMIDFLRTLSPAVSTLAPEEEAELEALKHLSDDALWTIAREQLADHLQITMQQLMDKNSLGTITADEFVELERLVERGQQLMVRKSEAAALLAQRGFKVTPKGLTARE